MTVVLINPFVVEPAHEVDFVAGWMETAAVFSAEPGYVDTRLHRSIDPDARFRYVNIAHWSSAEAWRDAMDHFPPKEKAQPGIEANPALYQLAPGGTIEAVHASRDIDAAIRPIEEGLARAYQTNDAGFLDRVLMDDYLVTDGPGTTSNKAKVLADHREARLKVSAFTFEAMDIVALSPTTAAARAAITGTPPTTDTRSPARFATCASTCSTPNGAGACASARSRR